MGVVGGGEFGDGVIGGVGGFWGVCTVGFMAVALVAVVVRVVFVEFWELWTRCFAYLHWAESSFAKNLVGRIFWAQRIYAGLGLVSLTGFGEKGPLVLPLALLHINMRSR